MLPSSAILWRTRPHLTLTRSSRPAAALTSETLSSAEPRCDWLPEMRKVAQSRPQVVVMEFAGNTFTPCMGGCPAGSSSAISRYCVDMSEAIHLFLAVGTRVFLEGSPIDYTEWATHDRHWIDLNRAFSSLATRYPGRVTYVDAGGAVEGPGQSFSWTLPCLSFEPCTGPIVSGVHTN